MKVKINTLYQISLNYYYVLFLLYTLSLVLPFVKTGALAAVYMLFISLSILIINAKNGFKVDLIIMLYILYNILSVLWFPFDRLPMIVYLTEIAYSILPICFYFIGNRNNTDYLFMEKSMNAIYYSLILGIILYIIAPAFYGNYLVDHSLSSNSAVGWIRSALQSVYGVTAVGTFSAIALFYGFMKIIKDNTLKYKIWVVVVSVTLFMSTRRSAWFAFAVVMLYFHYLLYLKWKKLKLVHFIIELVLILSIIILLNTVFTSELDTLLRRISSMDGAVGERSANWILGILATNNIYLGNGLGSMNHASAAYGNLGVYDSSYVKMYAETGFIGLILFFIIISKALFKGIRKIEKYYIEIGIITVFLIQAIGSNVLSFQVLAPIFWYSIGQCSNQRKK